MANNQAIFNIANATTAFGQELSVGRIVLNLATGEQFRITAFTAATLTLTTASTTPVGGGGAVDSVFGRTGEVTAQNGDYTAAQVGLGNVDNTSDANKPVSTAQQNALNLKQDILSEGAFVNGDKTKLNGIETGAEVNVQADWNETNTSSDAYIANKPDISGGGASTQSTATAGEALTAGDALRNGSLDVILSTETVAQTSSNNAEPIGQFTTQSFKAGQSFQATKTGTIPSVSFWLYRQGSASYQFRVRFFSDAALTQVIGTSTNTITLSTLTTSTTGQQTTFTFDNLVVVSGTTYYAVIERVDGGVDSVNFLRVRFNGSGGYNDGQMFRVVSPNTVTFLAPFDFRFSIVFNETEDKTRIYRTTNTQQNFIGMASSDAASGATVTIDTAGVNGSQSSLAPGTEYFLTSEDIISQTTGSSANAFGLASNARTIIAQTFTISEPLRLGGAIVNVSKTGTPTDNINVRLETVSGGNPTGTLVSAGASSSIAGADIGTSLSNHTISFSNTIVLAPGTYAITLSRSGAFDGSNFFSGGFASSNVADFGNPVFFQGGAWVQITNQDLNFSLVNAGAISTTGDVAVGKAISATELEIYTGGIVLSSNTEGISGADIVNNIISLTQAEYDAITPNASTFYIIT